MSKTTAWLRKVRHREAVLAAEKHTPALPATRMPHTQPSPNSLVSTNGETSHEAWEQRMDESKLQNLDNTAIAFQPGLCHTYVDSLVDISRAELKEHTSCVNADVVKPTLETLPPEPPWPFCATHRAAHIFLVNISWTLSINIRLLLSSTFCPVTATDGFTLEHMKILNTL